jgi:N-sulfoglucosamine sulfohydrolase
MSDTPRRLGSRFLGLLAVAMLVCGTGPVAAAQTADRPNILWIVCEDMSPMLGCYGDEQASTPNIDALARRGVRYTSAFASAPVCAVARSTIIYGVHAAALGTTNQRSSIRVPASLEHFPCELSNAGYATFNRSKTDYNDERPDGICWDDSSNRAHYRGRDAGRPFFAVFNLDETHESRISDDWIGRFRAQGRLPERRVVEPVGVRLPPFHPDTPGIREDWARQYDNIAMMDARVGELLEELEASGDADNTIVFFYSDHGGSLSRSKRYLLDAGLRVPLIVAFPQRWRHLSPVEPGGETDRVVSFVDLAPTVLSLAGVDVPGNMQGRAFLGESVQPAAPVALAYKDRMDERIDSGRSISDGRYRYTLNLMPHRPHGVHLWYPFAMQQNWRDWRAEWEAGRCDETRSAFWQPKAYEELYDTREDPWEIRNLVSDPSHLDRLLEMRRQLDQQLVAISDISLMPESLRDELAGEMAPYEFARSDRYDVRRTLKFARMAASGDSAFDNQLTTGLTDDDPIIRYSHCPCARL